VDWLNRGLAQLATGDEAEIAAAETTYDEALTE